MQPYIFPQRTVHDWVKDIRAKQKASRNSLVYRLAKLGWSSREIAEVDGRDYSTITLLLKNGDFAKIQQEYAEGRTIEEISRFYGIDLTLAYSTVLEGKTDEERMQAIGESIRKFTVWNFSDANPLF